MGNKINRRQFLVRGVGSLAGLTLAGTLSKSALGAIIERQGLDPAKLAIDPDAVVDTVALGEMSGLVVSRMAMGTGSVGMNNGSNQTRLGQEAFTNLLRYGYDHGVRFIDMAEGYGSMPFVGEAIKGLPRENLTLLSKMWASADNSPRLEPVRPRIEKYLNWLGSDYLDVLLIHCQMSGDWNTTRTAHMEAFSRAKEEGLVRSVGVSCHNIDALRTAASEPWVEVIMVRINPFGTSMDGPVDEVREIMRVARENGKGLIGMKIFGEGKHVTEPEREQSIRFALHEAGAHALTLGTESVEQMDDAIRRVKRIGGELA